MVEDTEALQPKAQYDLAAHAESLSKVVSTDSRLSSLSFSALRRYYLRQEPYEVVLHVRICAGGAGRPAFLPRLNFFPNSTVLHPSPARKLYPYEQPGFLNNGLKTTLQVVSTLMGYISGTIRLMAVSARFSA